MPGNALLIEDPVAIGAVLYMEGHSAHESAEKIKAIEEQLPLAVLPTAPRVILRGQIGTQASSLLVIVPRSAIIPGAQLMSIVPVE